MPSASLAAVGITGLATAVPPRAIDQQAAGEIAAGLTGGPRARVVPALYRRSGVKTRHSVLLEESPDGTVTQSFYQPAAGRTSQGFSEIPGMCGPTLDGCVGPHASSGPTTSQRMQRFALEAPPLAEAACRRALQRAGVPPSDVTHLITVCCTGFFAPGVELELIPQLGLDPQISRTHVGFMGCHGLMNALRMAAAVARGEPGAAVLVCAVEVCSLHHQYTHDPQQIVANALFSDGAAALVVQAAGPETPGWRLHDQRSLVVPETTDLMSWQIGDHGFQMTLSPRVPDVIRDKLRAWLAGWLQQHDLRVGDVRSWAVHPGGPRILTAAAEGAGFHPELLAPSQKVLSRHGNMSSPTIAFILEELLQSGARTPCVMLAFGPGLTIEAGLFISEGDRVRSTVNSKRTSG